MMALRDGTPDSEAIEDTQSKSIICSPVTNQNNFTVRSEPLEDHTIKEEIQESEKPDNELTCNTYFSTGNQSFKFAQYTQEVVTSSRKDKYQPENKLEESLTPNHNVTVKEESSCSLSKESSCSLSEESSCLSQPDVSTSDLSPNSIKNDAICDSDEELRRFSSNCKSDYASPPAPSKQKLRNTKRRAGLLYKQITSSKLNKNTSKYFNQAHSSNKNRWIPPRSPYALVQEDLFDNPWQLLVATIFLTKTSAKKALPQLHKFLARYPRPEDVLKANYEDIDEYFKPLGLTTTRSHIIMRFTVEFLEKDWTYPRELYGIGKYGDDSYRMFCINEWRQVSPDDIPLSMYRNWLLENADHLGLE